MPYRSEKQRRYMHAKLPKIAKRWDAEYGSKPKKKQKKRYKR
jgi:hypothetical protein